MDSIPKEIEPIPEYDFVSKEFEIDTHPYFKGNYLNCILSLNLRKRESVTVGIATVSMIFNYDLGSKCLHDLEKLCNIFRSMKSNEELVGGNKSHIVFLNPDSLFWPYQVQIKITKPTSHKSNYNLTFIQGGVVE